MMQRKFKQNRVEIRTRDDHLLIKMPDGVDFWEIVATIGHLMPTPEFQENHDIWLFREGKVDLTLLDLYKLDNFLTTHFPENAKGKKTAIVVESGFQQSLAETYANIGKNRLREIKVFSDLKTAESWITDSG